MKISTFKRIVKEDFPGQYQDLISKLAFPINILLDSYARGMTRNLSLGDNIACQVKDLSFKMTGVAQITNVVTTAGSAVPQSSYFTIDSANDTAQFYVWFNKAGGGSDPLLPNKTAIPVNIAGTETAAQIATLTAAQIATKEDFSTSVTNNTIVITNTAPGLSVPANNGIVSTGFQIVVSTLGSDTGVPSGTLSFQSTLGSKAIGMTVIEATNSTNSSVFPLSAPFVSWTESNKVITISNITGLQPNYTWSIKLIAWQ